MRVNISNEVPLQIQRIKVPQRHERPGRQPLHPIIREVQYVQCLPAHRGELLRHQRPDPVFMQLEPLQLQQWPQRPRRDGRQLVGPQVDACEVGADADEGQVIDELDAVAVEGQPQEGVQALGKKVGWLKRLRHFRTCFLQTVLFPNTPTRELNFLVCTAIRENT